MAADFSQINALDPRTLGNLQRLAKENSPEAGKEAAKQFEGLFLQQVLKSMRDASPKNSLFDSEESRMYQGMLDQQLALQLASRGGGIGLAKVIERSKALLGMPKDWRLAIVAAEMLVTVPEARHQRAAFTGNNLRIRWRADVAANSGDTAIYNEHALIGAEAAAVSVEDSHILEEDRVRGARPDLVHQRRRRHECADDRT